MLVGQAVLEASVYNLINVLEFRVFYVAFEEEDEEEEEVVVVVVVDAVVGVVFILLFLLLFLWGFCYVVV